MHERRFTDDISFVNASAEMMVRTATESPLPHLALSGGSTPAPIYRSFAASLSHASTPRIHLYQVDERYVSAEHPDSNQRMLRECIDPSPRFSLHCFDTSLPIDESVRAYTTLIEHVHFDLTILGLGPDGHTASLFPLSTAIHETSALVSHTTTNQFAIHDRLTLTFPSILSSRRLLLLLRGREKLPVLEELLHGPKSIDEFPAKRLLDHPDLTIFYLTN